MNNLSGILDNEIGIAISVLDKTHILVKSLNLINNELMTISGTEFEIKEIEELLNQDQEVIVDYNANFKLCMH